MKKVIRKATILFVDEMPSSVRYRDKEVREDIRDTFRHTLMVKVLKLTIKRINAKDL